MSGGTPSLTYRPEIDGLRAIAVWSGALFHAFPAIFLGGFVGVDMFFVISGYLISRIIISELQQSRFSIRQFYLRRVRRIFPALVVMLLGSLIFGLAFLPSWQWHELARHAVSGALFYLNFTSMGEIEYFSDTAIYEPLLNLWSLGIEEQFYLLWPALLVLAASLRIPFVYMISTVFALSAYARFSGIYDVVQAFFLPTTRMWELAGGGLVACLGRRELPSWFGMVGMAGIAVSLCIMSEATSRNGMLLLLPVLSSMLFVATTGSAVHRLLSLPLLRWGGHTSYSFYLIHWPALCFLEILASEPNNFQRMLVLLVSAALAHAVYRYVEQPARHTSQPEKTAGMWFVLLLVTAALSSMLSSLPMERASGFVRMDIVSEKAALRRIRRVDVCHNMPLKPETLKAYEEKCLGLSPDKPNVLLLGDSHGGDTYAAMSAAFPDINILQFTGKLCVLSWPETVPDCQQRTSYILDYIKDKKLDAVLLVAWWYRFEASQPLLDEVRQDLEKFKALNQNVVLLGGWPSYSHPTYRFLEHTPPTVTYNSYARKFLDKTMFVTASKMEDMAADMGIGYADLIPAFCTKGECQVVVKNRLLYLDENHLSVAGIRLLSRYWRKNPEPLRSLMLRGLPPSTEKK